MVAKPSDYSPASAIALAGLVEEAGFPPGVFNVVSGFGPEVGKALAAHPGVDKIAFTGSTQVGAEVAKAAAGQHHRGAARAGRQVRPPGLPRRRPRRGQQRRGGRGVRGDRADLHGRVPAAGAPQRARRAGGARSSPGRKPIKLGDPREAATEMGPLATEPQYQKVLSFFASAASEGAALATGGQAAGHLGGYFVEPTVLTNVKPSMTVACEEVFGPVLAVIPFDTEEEAIGLANDTRYGLAGAVWTKDIHRGHRVAHALRTGTVWINAYRVVGPDVPFGGFGASGLGRENGIEAVHEYTQTKAIWVELTGGTRDPFTLG